MPIEMILIVLVLVAGFYMAWNIGANDVANAMGTSVGSGALTLKQAVVIAAILEFSGAFFFGSYVSDTIQSGIIDNTIFSEKPLILVYGMLSVLITSGIWLQIASYYGWPVSTTHSIVGALVGFGAVVGGLGAIYWDHVIYIVTSWVLSPLLGGMISYFIFNLLRKKIFYTSTPVENAKKITPFLVFFVIFILMMILMYSGLRSLHQSFSFFKILGICLLVAGFGSLMSYYLVNRIKSTQPAIRPQVYNPEIALELEKAKKHLNKVGLVAGSEVKYQIALALSEVDQINQILKQSHDVEFSHLEFATVERIFGYLQIMSACMMAFAHGANDVANAIGPLSAAIQVLTKNAIVGESEIPVWILALGGLGIVIGLATWGWRVIETIGKKITELTPTRGFAAEFGAATTIVIASRLGLPISTTHTLVGSVIGVGLARGIEALDLRTTRDIVISWLFTVPAGAGMAVVTFYIIEKIFG
jgi:phosphate/sulfate permease